MLGGAVNKIVNTTFRWSGIDQGQTALASVARVAGSAVTSFAALATGAYVLSRRLADLYGGINDIAETTGIAASTLHAWDLRLRDAGTSVDAITPTLAIMASNLNDAANGMGTAKDALEALGLSAGDLQGLGLEEQFYRLMDALSGVSDETTRLALARDIFGRGAGQLNAIVTEGGEALRYFTEQAKATGQVLGDEAYQQADDFGTSMDRLNQRLQNAAYTLMDDLLPAFEGSAIWLDRLVNSTRYAEQEQAANEEAARGLTDAYLDEFEELRALVAQFEAMRVELETATGDTSALEAAYDALGERIMAQNQSLEDHAGRIAETNAAWAEAYNALLAYAWGLESLAEVLNRNPQLLMTTSVFTGAQGRISPYEQERLAGLAAAGEIGGVGGAGGDSVISGGKTEEAILDQMKRIAQERKELIAEIEQVEVGAAEHVQSAKLAALEAEQAQMQQWADFATNVVSNAWDVMFSNTRQGFDEMLRDMMMSLAKSGILKLLRGAITGGLGFKF